MKKGSKGKIGVICLTGFDHSGTSSKNRIINETEKK
jgi:hypothetical protein